MQQNNLEFELRLQQYIEMIRSRIPAKLLEATLHARKYLVPYQATHNEEICKASALLAYSPENFDAMPEAYKVAPPLFSSQPTTDPSSSL